MKKSIQNLVTIVTIVAGIVAVLSYIYQIKSNNPKLEILEITNENLTSLPRVKNLESNFYYKDSLITNLWKLNATIRNTGSKTIIGTGTSKNLIGDYLTFKLNEGFKLIDFNISENDFPYSMNRINNDVIFSFVQWRENEKIDVTVYAEQITSNNRKLEIMLNEREIIDGVIDYKKLNQPNENSNQIAINYLPKPLQEIFYWVGLVFFGLIFLVLPFGFYIELSKYYSFKKWKKKYGIQFKNKVNELYNNGEIKKIYNVEEASIDVWDKIDVPYPDIPTNPIGIMIFAMFTVFILFAIPLLWMIKI
ncbi:hypothetical protein [Winogradskyella sp. 3972H.M.0a.05]|uniref:hypothetical protein n=1 Tax=Winogradskyella sp. 3972H.M.0a.05 TaxID=2950277 RepID=UPI00339B03B1